MFVTPICFVNVLPFFMFAFCETICENVSFLKKAEQRERGSIFQPSLLVRGTSLLTKRRGSTVTFTWPSDKIVSDFREISISVQWF